MGVHSRTGRRWKGKEKVEREGGIRSKNNEALGYCDRDALNDNGERVLPFVVNGDGLSLLVRSIQARACEMFSYGPTCFSPEVGTTRTSSLRLVHLHQQPWKVVLHYTLLPLRVFYRLTKLSSCHGRQFGTH